MMRQSRLRHQYLLASVVLALFAGCSTSPRVITPFRVALTVVPREKTLDRDNATSPPKWLTLHDPAPENATARQVAFRTGRFNQKVDRSKQPPEPFKKSWHLDIALRTGGTKLASTKQKLDRRLDLPLKLDVLGVFKHPTTPIDRKSELGLNTMSFGFGRAETEKVGWNIYGGFGIGADRSHQRFLMTTLDVNFKYGVYYTGFTAEYYPWSRPKGYYDMSWTERFEQAKVYFVGGVEVGFVSAEADGDYSIWSTTLYKDGETIRDWTFSVPLGIGWAMPLDEEWTLQTVLDFRYHFYRPEEYNGWNLVSALRRRL